MGIKMKMDFFKSGRVSMEMVIDMAQCEQMMRDYSKQIHEYFNEFKEFILIQEKMEFECFKVSISFDSDL